MHDQPEPTEEENEQAAEPGRMQDEDAMRYPGHEDPDAERDRAGADDE